MPELISRQEALTRGLKSYFTDAPCRHGHVDRRRGCDGKCMECVRVLKRAHYRSGYRPPGRKTSRKRPPSYKAKAKSCEMTRYFTGKACVQGHVAERRTYDGKCVECKRNEKRLWWEKRNNKIKTAFKILKDIGMEVLV